MTDIIITFYYYFIIKIIIITLYHYLITGYAIECIICNSHTNSSCKTLTESSIAKYKKNCDEITDQPPVPDVKYTFCRKIDFYMDQDVGKRK